MANIFSQDWFSKGSGSQEFVTSMRKKHAAELAAQANVAALKGTNTPDQPAPAKPQGNIFQRAAGATGSFIKNAAVDLKDTTVDTAKGLVIAAESPFKEHAASQANAKQLEAIHEASNLTANWTANDYNDPKKKAQLDAINSKAKQYGEIASKHTASDKVSTLDAKKFAFQAGETAINVGTLGVGDLITAPGKALVKQGVKAVVKDAVRTGGIDTAEALVKSAAARQAVKDAAETAAKETALQGGKKLAAITSKDAVLGAGFGATSTGAQNPDASIADIGKGATMGGVLGGALPIFGGVLKKGLSKLTRTAKHVEPPAVGEVADTTPRNPDGSVDINKMLTDSAEAAASKHESGFLGKIAGAIGQHANPLGFAREIDQKVADRQGIAYSDLPANQSLEHNIQMKGNVDNIVNTLAREKTVTGDSFQDLAKKYTGDSPEAKEFNNYTLAKYDLDRRANGRQEILSGQKQEDLQKFVDEYEKKNPTAVKDLQTKNAFYQHAADELHAGGLISDKEHADITGSSDVATPFNRIFADKEALDGQQMPGRRTGSIAGQSVIKGIKGGAEPVDPSLDVVLERVHKAVSQRIDNNIANRLRDAAEHGDVNGRVFQEAGAKEAKAAARTERIQTNKSIRILTKKMGLSQRQANKIDTEINNLNKKGVSASLKSMAQRKDALKVETRAWTKTVAEKVRSNAPKTIDDLKQPLKIRQALAREYGEGTEGMQAMAADVFNGGWNQLVELSEGKLNKNTAKSLAGQIFKKDTIVPEKVMRGSKYVNKNKDVIRSVMSSLVDPATTAADVAKIQKKIAVREPKLAAKLDKVVEHKQLIDSQKAAVEDLKDIEVGLTREGTTGKAFINGVQNGQTFRVELPPKVINSLDKLSKTEVNAALKVVGAINQVFRIAWVGALAPGFAVKSALWDTTMGVINSPDGWKTLGPKAVKASFTAMKESDEFLQKLRKSGAATVGSSQLGIHAKVSAESLAATKSLFSRVKFGAKNPQSTIDSLDVFGGKLASLTRTRVARTAYDRALKEGQSEEEALSSAAYMYNNVMPDFATMSPLIRQINTIIPFTNASIAGTRSLAQGFKRAPLATAAKAAALGVTPAIAIAAYSMSSDSGRKFYQDMHDAGNDQVLNNNLIVVLPGAHKDDKTGDWTGIIKIPMAPEFRNINSQAWRTVEGLKGGKGDNGTKAAADLFDTVTGGVRTLSSPLVDIKTVLDGRDPRTGKQLVGDNLKDLPRDQQAYSTTSEAGTVLAKVLHTSPIQGDKILGSFGTAGAAAKSGSALDAVTGNAKDTYTGAYGQKTATAFYDVYTPVKAQRDAASKEVTTLVQQGKINEAKRKAQQYNDSLKGKFKGFAEKYDKSDAYNKNWDKMLSQLFISTSDNSFQARATSK